MTPTFYIWHWTLNWKLRQLAVPVPGQEAGSKLVGLREWPVLCSAAGFPSAYFVLFIEIFLLLPQTLIESSGTCDWIMLYLNEIRDKHLWKNREGVQNSFFFFFRGWLRKMLVCLSVCACMCVCVCVPAHASLCGMPVREAKSMLHLLLSFWM